MKRFLIKNGICILLGIVLSWSSVHAQLNIGGKAFSSLYDFRQEVPVELMPSLDMTQIKLEDLEDDQNNEPPRFGFGHDVDFNLENSGSWYDLPNGDRVWQLSIYCPQATSINLLYNQYRLPEGAVLYIYNKDKSHQIGGFTARNNKFTEDGEIRGFATGLVYGNFVTLEYYEPKAVSTPGIISISKVVHGYKVIDIRNTTSEELGDGGNCQVNINCAEGNNWQEEKRAVALMIVDGTRWCTGSLVNNTCGNLTPLFLTADHCLRGRDAVDDSDAAAFSFMWNYEAPGCANVTMEPAFFTTSGATVMANDDRATSADFAILLLDEDPADITGFTPYYMGWDRNNNPGARGVGIHHPAGDVKKIATHNMLPTGECGVANTGLPRWFEVFWDATANGQSVTEGGSSGSPLLNRSHRVIGQLWGGNNCSGQPNCSDPGADEGLYGAIAFSWNNSGATDSRRRLRDWLDPCASGDLVMDGTSGCHTDLSITDDINWAVEYEVSNTINANNVIGNASNNGLGVRYDAGVRVRLAPGFSTVYGAQFHAQIDGCGGSNPRSNDVIYYEGLPERTATTATKASFASKVYPNPFSENMNLELVLEEEGMVQLSLYTANGQLLRTIWKGERKDEGLHNYELKGNTMPNGIYFLKIQVNGTTEIKPISLLR